MEDVKVEELRNQIKKAAKNLIICMTDKYYYENLAVEVVLNAEFHNTSSQSIKIDVNGVSFFIVFNKIVEDIIRRAIELLFKKEEWGEREYHDVIEDAISEYINKLGFSDSTQILMLINQVSSQYHERETPYGLITRCQDIDTNSDDYNVVINKRIGVSFVNPIPFVNTQSSQKLIRKYLNLSSNNVALILDKHSTNIVGISKTNTIEVDDVAFQIKGFMDWEFREKGKIVFSYLQGKYRVYSKVSESITLQKLTSCFKAYYTNSKVTDEQLGELLNNVSRQKHGTSIILGPRDFMLKEARRLCWNQRGYRVNVSFKDDCDYITHLTAIDGAVIIDDALNCLSIGTILDGETVTQGETHRGARYNSISNYVAWLKRRSGDQCTNVIGVIVSEDRTVDIIYSDDYGDYQSLEVVDLVITPKICIPYAASEYYDGQSSDYECKNYQLPFKKIPKNYADIVSEYNSTITLIDFDNPTCEELTDNTYLFINLVGVPGSGKTPAADVRLILKAGELVIKKSGCESCIMQILEVGSDIPDVTGGLKRLFGKNAYKRLSVGDGEIIKIKIAYAFLVDRATSIGFSSFHRYKDVDGVSLMSEDTKPDTVTELLKFQETRYVIQLHAKNEVFTFVFWAKLQENRRFSYGTISGVTDDDFNRALYERAAF